MPGTLAFLRGLDPWLLVGFAGQGLFVARALVQWVASERAGRSVAPLPYWWLSVAGSVLMLVYAAYTRDPIFVLGPFVNLYVYGRNLALEYRAGPPRPARLGELLPVALALATFAAISLAAAAWEKELFRPSPSQPWIGVGVIGITLFASRYLVQWWASERVGRSVLPAGFWWLSLAGALALLAYAVHRVDWVFICAYVLNPVPYARNLVLIRRAREATAVSAQLAARPERP